ncbi:endoribonuclease [Chitinophaga sp. MD30]|nr:endoribonuclease [Chitinophaga sp. MD30]
MVVKKYILKTISALDGHYNAASVGDAVYYSKLAIIELCGWIESSMDDIVQHFADRKLKTASYQRIFRKEIKGKNYGFEYETNFRKMMHQTIGLHNMESIEVKLDRSGQIAILLAELNALKLLRNDAAHTHIDATKTYQAPSVTKAQLLRIYPILKEIDREVKAIR